jgi:hypothetical protein
MPERMLTQKRRALRTRLPLPFLYLSKKEIRNRLMHNY